MSPTPVTFSSPTAPATYTWEATDEEVAARYGVDPRDDRPLRPQHLAGPAGARRPAPGGRPVRGAAVRVPADRLPPPRRGRRRALRRDPGRDPRRGRRGRDPRHRRQGVPPAGRRGRSSRPRPTRCTASSPSSAGRRVVAVPRLGADGGLGARRRGDRARPPRDAAVVWLCSPNNPTALAEPDGAIADAPRPASPTTRPRPADRPRSSSSTRPTPSSSGRSLLGLRDAYPNLIVVRTASKAYALAGLRVGFALARPEVIARLNPYRPPGSVSTVSVTLVTEALRDRRDPRRQPRPRRARADAPDRRPCARPAGRSARRSRTSSWSTSARRSGPAPSPRACCAAASCPRTFPAGHPLADHLRLTVRTAAENDRLIAAADRAGQGDRPHDDPARRHRGRSARGPPRDDRPDDRRDRHHRHARPRRRGSHRRSIPASASTTTCSARSPTTACSTSRSTPTATSRSTSTTRSRTSRSCSAPPSPRRSATGPGSPGSATAPSRWTRRSPRPSSTSAAGRTRSSTCRSAASGSAACRSSSSSTPSSRSPGPPAPRST